MCKFIYVYSWIQFGEGCVCQALEISGLSLNLILWHKSKYRLEIKFSVYLMCTLVQLTDVGRDQNSLGGIRATAHTGGWSNIGSTTAISTANPNQKTSHPHLLNQCSATSWSHTGWRFSNLLDVKETRSLVTLKETISLQTPTRAVSTNRAEVEHPKPLDNGFPGLEVKVWIVSDNLWSEVSGTRRRGAAVG